jgi:hypothetical protein
MPEGEFNGEVIEGAQGATLLQACEVTGKGVSCRAHSLVGIGG